MDRDLLRANLRDRKADRIPIAGWRKMRTGCGVAEIAEFAEVRIRGCQLLSRGAAVARPSRAQRQTRRVRPGAIVQNFSRHKKRAGQIDSPEKNHCNARRDMNGKQLLGELSMDRIAMLSEILSSNPGESFA